MRSPRPADGADDSERRHRTTLPRATDRENEVAGSDRRVRPRGRRQIGDIDFEERDIAARIATDQGCGDIPAIGKTDLDILVLLNDVVGGDDRAVRAPDDSGRWHSLPSVDGD